MCSRELSICHDLFIAVLVVHSLQANVVIATTKVVILAIVDLLLFSSFEVVIFVESENFGGKYSSVVR